MKSLRNVFLAGAAGLALAACAASTPVSDVGPDASVIEEETGLLAQVTITPDSAMAIAKARVPGRITEADLEKEGDKLVYSFDIKVAGKDKTTEIDVDAMTGIVLKVEE